MYDFSRPGMAKGGDEKEHRKEQKGPPV